MLAAVLSAIDVVLRDGATVRLRPAFVDDRDRLREFYEQLSPESRYFRFFGKPRVGDIVDDVVHDVASEDAVTLVAEADHRIVAIAPVLSRLTLLDEPKRRLPSQTRTRAVASGPSSSSGSASIARSRGITSFEAYLLHDNQKMRQVFVDSGFELTWDRVDGRLTHVVFSLKESESCTRRGRHAHGSRAGIAAAVLSPDDHRGCRRRTAARRHRRGDFPQPRCQR